MIFFVVSRLVTEVVFCLKNCNFRTGCSLLFLVNSARNNIYSQCSNRVDGSVSVLLRLRQMHYLTGLSMSCMDWIDVYAVIVQRALSIHFYRTSARFRLLCVIRMSDDLIIGTINDRLCFYLAVAESHLRDCGGNCVQFWLRILSLVDNH